MTTGKSGIFPKHNMPPPLLARLREVATVVRAAALLSAQRSFGDEAAAEEQVRQLVRRPIGGLGGCRRPGRERGAGAPQRLAIADDAHLLPHERLEGAMAE